VKPIVLKVHPDFDSIVAGQGYWEWAEKQRSALKVAALNSGDPLDIIWAVSEYKAFLEAKGRPSTSQPEKIAWQETFADVAGKIADPGMRLRFIRDLKAEVARTGKTPDEVTKSMIGGR
jgi:hypothetical protein